MEGRRRRRLLATVLVTALLAVAAAGAAYELTSSGPTPAEIAARRAAEARARLVAAEDRAVRGAEAIVAVRLPTRSDGPAPTQAAPLFRPGKDRPHLVVGYVPYWTMSDLTRADFVDTSVLCYYGVAIGPAGQLVRHGPGWAPVAGTGLTGLVARGHAARDRVLLTVWATDPSVIAHLVAHPVASAARLVHGVVPLLAAERLDGISLDVEGRDPAERSRFTAFVAAFSARLRRADPGSQLIVDTYPQSADDPADFFDVGALGHLVDDLFVMGYDMEDPHHPSAGAPLISPPLGLSDVQAILAYERVVAPAKLVLGVPFYGLDYTLPRVRHADGRHAATAPGAAAPSATAPTDPPSAVTYASIADLAKPASWDAVSLTPFTRFRQRGIGHETFYDDPVSIALKTALAEEQHLAGMGAWALGDEGGAAAMLVALDGGAAPSKLPLRSGPSPAAVAAAETP